MAWYLEALSLSEEHVPHGLGFRVFEVRVKG